MRDRPTQLPEPWRSEYALRQSQIQARLRDFTAVPPSEYFYELAFCILTPQSSARNADLTIAELRADRFLEKGQDPTPYLRDSNHYIRFHNVKSRRLLTIRESWPELQRMLEVGHARCRSAAESDLTASAMELRAQVLHTISGFGLKEASHFLRNIGIQNLAILDRHIFKHLTRLGILAAVPVNAPTSKQYFAIENTWREFAASVGVPLDELDLLFWSMETGQIRK